MLHFLGDEDTVKSHPVSLEQRRPSVYGFLCFSNICVIEFLLHNSYPVVCSGVLCQAGSLFFLPVLLFFDTFKGSDYFFNKKKKKEKLLAHDLS